MNSAAHNSHKTNGWLFSPAIDLLFACGGLFWLLVLMHLCLVWQLGRKIVDFPFEVALLYFGNVFLSNAHISSTLYRLYGDKLLRKKLWYHSYLAAVIFAGVMIASAFNPLLFAITVLLYLALQIDHVNSQNYGVSLLYCYRAGFKFTSREKLLSNLCIMHLAGTQYFAR